MKIVFLIAVQCICVIFPGVELLRHDVSSGPLLQEAIEIASPGDTISLSEGDFHGDFNIRSSGSNGNPIKIVGKTVGSKNSRIIPKKTAFSIDGDHWVIDNLNTNGGDVGVKISGKHNTLSRLSINGASTALVISAGSCCGKVEKTSWSGDVDILGNNYTITSTSGSGNFKLGGCGNTLTGNSLGRKDITTKCENSVDDSNVFSNGGNHSVVADTFNIFLMQIMGLLYFFMV